MKAGLPRRAFVTLACAIAPVLAQPAAAEPPLQDSSRAISAPLRISAAGDCPSPDAVTSTIQSLIPQHLADVARRDRVVAEGRTNVRVYRDVGRDCAYRARVAAVFIVLTLMPPEVLMESPPPPPPAAPPAPPPPAPIPPAPPPPPAPRSRISLQLAGVVDVAPAIQDAASTVSPGAELRIGLQRRRLAGEIGLGVQPRADFALVGVDARQRRFPFDLSLVFRQPVRAIELGVAVGIAGAIFSAEGTNSFIRSGGTRLDLGARAAVEIRVGGPSRRFGAFASAHALYFPRQYELVATPSGVVGLTPALWVGASAGVSVSF
jgi:hypothetical protein